MKISRIQTKRVVSSFSNNFFKKQNKTLPYVKEPVVLYLLQNEKQFKLDLLGKSANNQYILPEEQKTLNIIETLENKKIIKPQYPWETPRFNNGTLNDDAYNNIVDKIAASNKLTPYQKEQYINQLANCNYKSYKPTFQGKDEIVEIETSEEPSGFFSAFKSKMKNFFGKHDGTTSVSHTPILNEVEEKARLQEDLKWIDSINEQMCPECEAIYNATPTNVPEGLISDIMGDIPEGFAVDNSLLKMLKKMTRDLLGE